MTTRVFVRKKIAILLTLALIVSWVGSWILLASISQRDLDTMSKWPTVAGSVIFSKTEVTRGKEGDEYTLVVNFSYDIQGEKHLNEQSWDVFEPGKETMYPQGSVVTVYYDPANPDESVINPLQRAISWMFLQYFVTLAIIGGCTGIWLWATCRKKEQMPS